MGKNRDPENKGSNVKKKKKAKRIPWMMVNSSHKKTALKPAEKGTAPIRVEGTEVSKVVFLREKKKKVSDAFDHCVGEHL